jgi:hypothetical protein
MEVTRNSYKISVGKPDGRDDLRDLGVDGRPVLHVNK